LFVVEKSLLGLTAGKALAEENDANVCAVSIVGIFCAPGK